MQCALQANRVDGRQSAPKAGQRASQGAGQRGVKAGSTRAAPPPCPCSRGCAPPPRTPASPPCQAAAASPPPPAPPPGPGRSAVGVCRGGHLEWKAQSAGGERLIGVSGPAYSCQRAHPSPRWRLQSPRAAQTTRDRAWKLPKPPPPTAPLSDSSSIMTSSTAVGPIRGPRRAAASSGSTPPSPGWRRPERKRKRGPLGGASSKAANSAMWRGSRGIFTPWGG